MMKKTRNSTPERSTLHKNNTSVKSYDATFIHWAQTASIGERIRWLIEHVGYTQVQLAEKMSLTQASISNWITGSSRKPSAPSLLKLAAALGANPNWIISGEGHPFEVPPSDSKSEMELLNAFRSLDPSAQAGLIAAAKAMKG